MIIFVILFANLWIRSRVFGKSQMRNDVGQVHIAIGNTSSEMLVMWSSSSIEQNSIAFGTKRSQLANNSKVMAYRFTERNTAGVPYIFRAKLSNLLPGTKYYYRIATSNIIHNFTTLREGHKWGPKFLIYGDLGLGTHSMPALIKEATSSNYTSILHLGDFAYNLWSQGGVRGDQFMDKIQPMASSVPYMTCPGDHEGQGDFVHYRTRFSMPSVDWPSSSPKLWYTFTAGLVRIISLSSEVYYNSHTNDVKLQQLWLADVLQKAERDRSRQPWLVVIGHRPMYCSSQFPSDDCHREKCKLRDGLEPLLKKAGVDMYLSGHSHVYERSWPLHQMKVAQKSYIDVKSPIHVTCGSMGNYIFSETFSNSQPEWSAKRMPGNVEVYCVLEVINATHLLWSAINAFTKKVEDQIWISRNSLRTAKVAFTHPRNFAAGMRKHSHTIMVEKSSYALLVVILLFLLFGTVLRRQFTKCLIVNKRLLFNQKSCHSLTV